MLDFLRGFDFVETQMQSPHIRGCVRSQLVEQAIVAESTYQNFASAYCCTGKLSPVPQKLQLSAPCTSTYAMIAVKSPHGISWFSIL
jgi:hypothetical protein